MLPGLGVTVNGAHALARRRPAPVPALGAAQARARALRGAARWPQRPRAHARRSTASSTRCCSWSRRACLLLARRSPTSARRSSSAFTIGDAARRRRHAGALLGASIAGTLLALVADLRAARALPAGAADVVHRPVARTRAAPASRPCRRQIAIGSGGLFGVGLGESVQKIFYLPEAHTDFILAVIGEELGLVGICGVLVLYGMLGLRRPARGQAGQDALRQAARRRDHLADPLPGDAQRLRRARAWRR